MTPADGDHNAEVPTHVRVHPQTADSTDFNAPGLSKRMSAADRIEAQAKSTVPILRQLLRLLAIAAVVVYIVVCVMAVNASITILRGSESHTLAPDDYPCSLIAEYAGSSTLDKSPLVQDILGGDTSTDRADAIFLESGDTHSFDGCTQVTSFNSELYSPTYLRFMFDQMKRQLAYNVSDFTDLELVNYFIASQFRRGSAFLTSIAFITDMSASKVDYVFAIALNYPYEATPKFIVCEVITITSEGFWHLQTVPVNPFVNSRADILTAWLTGFYIDDPQSQSNVKNNYWELFTKDPVTEVSLWRWRAETVLRDSWAWAHFIHAIFAFYTAFQLGVLFFVMGRRFRSGHVWVGDAFSSISGALLYRGVLVLIANQLNGFYTWTEYALAIGYPIAEVPDTIMYRPELLFPDLLTIYLNVTSIVSYVVKERIEPLLAFGSFIAGFYFRTDQAKFFPIFRDVLVAFADVNYDLGNAQVGEAFERLSPFRLRTVSHIDMSTRGGAMLAAVTSIITGLIYVGLFIVARKVYRFARKRQATGAALQKRFGVISSYNNYIELNGRRYATADAVYSNGFLVANRKFLVATGDLLSILLIKSTHVRFKNVFVYELTDGDTAKQTARLLYPQTIQWSDLLQLDVCDLA